MVSKRATRVHAPETCAPILDSRHAPSRKPVQRLHWRSRYTVMEMGMGTIPVQCRAEGRHVGCL